MKEELDCRRCGACCICSQDQDVFCDVTDDDLDILSPKFVREHVKIASTFDRLAHALDRRLVEGGAIKTRWKEVRSGPLKGYEMNTCVALRGSVMHKVSCSIYKRRPSVCRRAVGPGDRACKEVRRAFFGAIERLKEEE